MRWPSWTRRRNRPAVAAVRAARPIRPRQTTASPTRRPTRPTPKKSHPMTRPELKMNQLKKHSAIKALMLLALFWMAGASWAAQVAGTIVQLSGPLLAKKADGAVRILSMRSEIESGDTLVTEKNTYAMVKFI